MGEWPLYLEEIERHIVYFINEYFAKQCDIIWGTMLTSHRVTDVTVYTLPH